MKKTTALSLFLLCAAALPAQMRSGADTLYGNEWIDFSKTYYRFEVWQDGICRIPAAALADAGFPLQSGPAAELRLYRHGRQVPVFISTDGPLGPGDFIEFYGEKNRSELDRFLFDNPDAELLNPRYSLFNDTAAYYLCRETGGSPARIATLPNDLTNPPPPEPFCWYTLESVFSAAHFKRRHSAEITLSWFDGEGFHKGFAASSPVSMNPLNRYAAGPPAEAELRYAGDLGDHHQLVKLKLGTKDTLLFDDQFADFKIVQHHFAVPQHWLGAQTRIALESTNLIDQHALAFVSLRYPRLCDAGLTPQFAFSLDASAAPKYLEISDFDLSGGAAPLLFDLDAGLRIEATVESGLVKILLPPAAQPRRLLLVNAGAGVREIGALRPLKFRDFSTGPAQYILLSHPAFFSDPENGGANPVADYAAYRQSPEGGGYTVAIADVLELYEQFAYGTARHPLAVRNFAHWVKKNWPDPRFLFLVGKGLHYDLVRDPAAATALADSLFFVPTFGSPGADPLFVTGNAAEKPIFPVGRLAATRPSEVSDYLQKVREHEANAALPQTLADRAWMKKIVHLSGGNGPEADVIRDAMGQMAATAAQSRMGADVVTFYKTTNAPVETSTFERIRETVNAGAALVTLFGHSAAQVVDFDIGTPDAYDNRGRYPLFATLGCFSGICSAPAKGLGEQFVLAKDRGALAFFASANYGLLEPLRVFSEIFYQKIGGDGYGKTIGEQLSATTESLENSGDQGLEALLHQLVLQGDPALRLPAAPGPDFLPDAASARLTPNPAAIEQGAFALDVDLVNLGEHRGGSVAVRVQQRLPNDSLRTLALDTLDAPPFRRTLHFEFAAPGREALGFNRLLVTADPDAAVAELPAPAAEMNNDLRDASGQAGVEIYFFADDVQPVFPPPFGIAGQTPLVLRASTFGYAPVPRRFLFELDTTPRFDSPLKQSGQVLRRGGLIDWAPPGSLPESTVYFWRVARDSLVDGAVPWRSGSFLYAPGNPPGWNQSTFFQWTGNRFSNLKSDTLARQLAFVDNAAFASVSVAALRPGKYPGIQNSYYEGFTGYGGFISKQIKRGVVLALLDPLTGRFQKNPVGSPTNPSPLFTVHFHYFDTDDSLRRVALMEFLKNDIPDGWYAALLGLHNPALPAPQGYSPEKWAADSVTYGANLFQLLEQQGARRVRALQTLGSRPYGFIFRKNDPSFAAVDTVLNDPEGTVELRRNFPAKWSGGEMESPRIGPALAWDSLHWRHGPLDGPSEMLQLALLAPRDGQPDSLLLTLSADSAAALGGIDAVRFPYLKLRLTALDTVWRSMPALERLRLWYRPFPEGALHPAAGYLFHTDTLQQGERLRAAIVFQNAGQSLLDSLQWRFRVENEQNTGPEFFQKYHGLAPGDTLWARFELDTRMLSGPQRLRMEANPATSGQQPEQQSFNNLWLQNFYVRSDRVSPLLDVTFDGRYILPNDLVSARPEIVATLLDENRFLTVSDTAAFSLTLTYPDQTQENIRWDDPRVLFVPAAAGGSKNRARLEFRPALTQDGAYRLRVSGRDASGNAAGIDYRMPFRVITRSSLGRVLNYPNPFSTSTCFVYTMTGAETPAFFNLQIMTLSGKVVREVTAAEFGPLHVGTHRSTFCWDGTDQYGDRLANGVYLYRVTARKADGSPFELLENEGLDGFFKNGVGKMVLVK